MYIVLLMSFCQLLSLSFHVSIVVIFPTVGSVIVTCVFILVAGGVYHTRSGGSCRQQQRTGLSDTAAGCH